MSTNLPTIIKDSERLLDGLERDVPGFPKKYRYMLGQSIREEAMQGALLSQQAMMVASRQAQLLQQLSVSNDRLKLFLQTAHRRQCFKSAGQFEIHVGLARSVGRQCGALIKSVSKHLNGQSAGALVPPAASRDTEYPRHPTGVNV